VLLEDAGPLHQEVDDLGATRALEPASIEIVQRGMLATAFVARAIVLSSFQFSYDIMFLAFCASRFDIVVFFLSLRFRLLDLVL